uniref:SJCHGC05254 protein n=1 Tax=Schistosoma japonicum TaxID=6182 RepID=Q5DFY3_SCHJA|nr:SJCHGC05254 protein [Schistosoma japonicum]
MSTRTILLDYQSISFEAQKTCVFAFQLTFHVSMHSPTARSCLRTMRFRQILQRLDSHYSHFHETAFCTSKKRHLPPHVETALGTCEKGICKENNRLIVSINYYRIFIN